MSDSRSQDLAYSRYNLTLDSTSAAYHLAPEPDFITAADASLSVPRGTVGGRVRDQALEGTETLEWVFRPKDHVTIPPKYKNCLVFLRSFSLINNQTSTHCRAQFLRVQLMNANMPNNYHALSGTMKIDRQDEGGQRITRGQTLAIVPLRADIGIENLQYESAQPHQSYIHFNHFAMKHHEFAGDVASRGKLLAGTLLNDEITIRLDVPTPTTDYQHAIVDSNESDDLSLARHFLKYDGIAVANAGGTGGDAGAIGDPMTKWVMELEIQMLENRHD